MIYQIKVQGQVDPSWSDWLNGMQITTQASPDAGWVTVLTGPMIDQADLRGILDHLWDMNLTILSVNRVEAFPGERRS